MLNKAGKDTAEVEEGEIEDEDASADLSEDQKPEDPGSCDCFVRLTLSLAVFVVEYRCRKHKESTRRGGEILSVLELDNALVHSPASRRCIEYFLKHHAYAE